MFKFGKKVNQKVKELADVLLPNANVLDLGCGAGANSVFLTKRGFNVVCVDKNKEIIENIKKEHQNINTFAGDILSFGFLTEKYDMVLALNVLHFFNVEQTSFITKKILKSLKRNGVLYLQVFSTKDPSFGKFIEVAESRGGENTFYSKKMQSFVHFFEKEELRKLFPENKILELEEKIKIDNHPPAGKHKHVTIEMLVRK